jgi:hypothetical protein
MPSRTKTILNMVMCSTILTVASFYPTDLNMIGASAYPLFVYCIVDIIGNSWDMVIHHISTVMVGLVLHYYRYESQDLLTTCLVARSFISTEISTLFLDLIHLGYRHILIRLGFLLTFTYFRVFRLPWLLILSPDTCYFCTERTNYICGPNQFCHMLWSTGSITLMSLNTMWFYKLLRKALQKNNPKPTIKG